MDFAIKTGKYAKFIAYVVAIILINVAGLTLFFRVDVTKNNIYSISAASKAVVSTLSEPLTINVFFTEDLPAPHNNTERYLHDLLQEYAAYGNEYFNYRFYNVSPKEGDLDAKTRRNQTLAKDYGIQPVQIQAIEEDEVKFQKAYMGLVIIHGDLIERIPTITTTDGLEYRLTTAIQKLNNKISSLLRLSEKIRIKLFLSSSLQTVAPYMRLTELPRLPEALEKTIREVNARNYDKLAFEYLDPTTSPQARKASESYQLMKLQWPELPEDDIPAGEGIIGLVMEHGKKVKEIPLIHVMRIPLIGKHYELVNTDDIADIINENIESLIDINEDLGYLADHGTLSLAGASPMDPMGGQDMDNISNFKNLVSQNYSLQPINLKEDSIPASLDCLVIARPTEPLSDYALFQIDQFLMQGKNLAVFLDAFQEVQQPQQQRMMFNQPPRYVPVNSGLEKLLAHYGVRVKRAYVLDENCYVQEIPAQFGGGQRNIYFAPIIKRRFINDDIAVMNNIKGLVAMRISPLELDAERIKEDEIAAITVFSSSEKSWEMKGRINLNPMLLRPPQSPDEQQSFPLAYILEGSFSSYFAGKPVPEKESPEDRGDTEAAGDDAAMEESLDEEAVDLSMVEAEGEVIPTGKPGRIFLISSAEILKNNMMDQEGRTPNAMFVMNMIDYLNDREEIALMRSKQQRFNPLNETGPGTKAFVKWFNIIGLPVIVMLFGLLVWFTRHNRRKRIQMMFE